MIGSLCEAYHWTIEEALKLTTPQIILLCHASSEQAKKFKDKHSDNKYDYSRNTQSNRIVDNKDMDPVVYQGKKLSELVDDENWETGLLRYLGPLTQPIDK